MIFTEANESGMNQVTARKESQWVEIGLKFLEERKEGKTAKEFAAERNIPYGTFTKSMSRYKTQIEMAQKVQILAKKPYNKLTSKEKSLIMINSFRASIRDKVRNHGAAVNNKSAKWFADTMKSSVRGHKVSRPEPGRIYAFAYDAKHKDTLPYWDKYPLIVFLGVGKQGASTLLYGLNLHYIPPKARQSFLEELLTKYSTTGTITNSTRLKIDWSKVKGMQGADKMIKAYLPSHIQGQITEIKPSDWSNVVLLPLQQFMSKGKRFSANRVWK